MTQIRLYPNISICTVCDSPAGSAKRMTRVSAKAASRGGSAPRAGGAPSAGAASRARPGKPAEGCASDRGYARGSGGRGTYVKIKSHKGVHCVDLGESFQTQIDS